jgi:hypothetical protein
MYEWTPPSTNLQLFHTLETLSRSMKSWSVATYSTHRIVIANDDLPSMIVFTWLVKTIMRYLTQETSWKCSEVRRFPTGALLQYLEFRSWR